MLISEEEAAARLVSPLNLVNRMRDLREKSFSVIPERDKKRTEIVSLPPSIDSLVENIEEKLQYSTIHKSALEIMDKSLNELKLRIPNINKPERIAAIAKDMNVIIHRIDESRVAKRIGDDNRVQIMIYAPSFRAEAEYESVLSVE